MAKPTYTELEFNDLLGWCDDDHRTALDVFRTTKSNQPDLPDPANTTVDPRLYFEAHFRPVLIEDGNPMLFTGYFEPELSGSREPTATFRYPLYAIPDNLVPDQPFHTRRAIEENQVLANKGLELAWLADPVEVFFLQVQGSGRIKLPDGSVMRVGFGAKNGHPYTSIGKVLVSQGHIDPINISAVAIGNWVRDNADAGRALLWENKSYVFFREVSEVPADQGPLGAMNRSITAGRSIAVDPDFIPLGVPVWIEKSGAAPMHRLMIAQDTGSAIKGAQRADIFFGTGQAAGQAAGQIKDGGRIVVLLPNAQAAGLTKGSN